LRESRSAGVALRLAQTRPSCYYLSRTMEISENELIRRIRRFEKKAPRVIRGIGDDGAVVDLDRGEYVLVQDAMVEGVHFRLDYGDLRDVGRKAVYVNVSDILAMGALPLYFLITIAVPPRYSSKDIGSLYRGITQAAREYGVALLGGDTTAAGEELFIDVSMVGRIVATEYWGRDKAKAGDLMGVTGFLGESAYGLELLKGGFKDGGRNRFVERYRAPKPPLALWRELVKRGITKAMMDISDGLLIDCERMMAESRKAARIYLDKVPMPPSLKRAGKESLALSGGEDYQFLFAFAPETLEEVERMRGEGFHLSVVGEVVEGRGVKLISEGRVIESPARGYEHFRARP
jgi:thiamine-monophosphate kinase